jgi:hypothetical protein
MSITAYPRTIVKGQVAANGNANSGVGLMLWDSATGTYIAATPSTFSAGGGGDATAANQTTQISEANSTNVLLTDIKSQDNTQYNSGSNSGVLIDSIQTAICTTFASPLIPFSCKYVTIVNYATNSAPVQISVGAGTMQLDKGYSIRINTSSSGFISISQITGEGNTIAYIVTQ